MLGNLVGKLIRPREGLTNVRVCYLACCTCQRVSATGGMSLLQHKSPTIYALSSGQGRCGVAVVRISGSDALSALKTMAKLPKPEPRRAYLKRLVDPESGDVIDKGLCLWFPGPRSFTGEDTVELQVHGGSAILEALMASLSKLNFRMAEPGEFTKRAFYNDKLDLTEIEGLADLIHAETEQQRRQALLQADGSLSKLYNNWREVLSRNLANIEAYIDFSEDDNIEDGVLQNCNDSIKNLSISISNHLSDGRKGEILRSGIRTVILGQPNAGKSSLLNHLVQRNAAIVTPIAGTTRDIVELTANISGYPVILADTAGLVQDTADIVEQEGIRRAKVHAKHADFIILMVDASAFVSSGQSFHQYIKDYVKRLEIEDLIRDEGLNHSWIIIVNKIDLVDGKVAESIREIGAIPISCSHETGFSLLIESLSKRFQQLCGNPNRENPTISQARHRIHLVKCHEYLSDYLSMISHEDYDMVIAAQKIRSAMRELGKITGNVTTEEILDIIFSNFCIGK